MTAEICEELDRGALIAATFDSAEWKAKLEAARTARAAALATRSAARTAGAPDDVSPRESKPKTLPPPPRPSSVSIGPAPARSLRPATARNRPRAKTLLAAAAVFLLGGAVAVAALEALRAPAPAPGETAARASAPAGQAAPPELPTAFAAAPGVVVVAAKSAVDPAAPSAPEPARPTVAEAARGPAADLAGAAAPTASAALAPPRPDLIAYAANVEAPQAAGAEVTAVNAVAPAPEGGRAPPEADAPRTRTEGFLDLAGRREVQIRLTLLGFDTKGADGVFGPNTRAAIKSWQAGWSSDPDGYLTPAATRRLQRQSEPAYAASRSDRTARRTPADGCARDGAGRIVQAVSFRCDARALMEALTR